MVVVSPRTLGERDVFQNEVRVLEIQGEGEKSCICYISPSPDFLAFASRSY